MAPRAAETNSWTSHAWDADGLRRMLPAGRRAGARQRIPPRPCRSKSWAAGLGVPLDAQTWHLPRAEVASAPLGHGDRDIESWRPGTGTTSCDLIRRSFTGCAQNLALNPGTTSEKIGRWGVKRIDLGVAVDTPDGMAGTGDCANGANAGPGIPRRRWTSSSPTPAGAQVAGGGAVGANTTRSPTRLDRGRYTALRRSAPTVGHLGAAGYAKQVSVGSMTNRRWHRMLPPTLPSTTAWRRRRAGRLSQQARHLMRVFK